MSKCACGCGRTNSIPPCKNGDEEYHSAYCLLRAVECCSICGGYYGKDTERRNNPDGYNCQCSQEQKGDSETKENLRVVVIKPGLPAKIREVGHDLASLQALVGGYIEHVFFKDNIGFLIHEEGKLIGLPPNRIDYHGDILVGTVVIVKTCEGEFCSLTEAEAEDLRKLFNY